MSDSDSFAEKIRDFIREENYQDLPDSDDFEEYFDNSFDEVLPEDEKEPRLLAYHHMLNENFEKYKDDVSGTDREDFVNGLHRSLLGYNRRNIETNLAPTNVAEFINDDNDYLFTIADNTESRGLS